MLEKLIGKPIAQQIETHVRALSSVPHYAGTDTNAQKLNAEIAKLTTISEQDWKRNRQGISR